MEKEMLHTVLSMVGMLVFMGLVFAGAWWVSRQIAGRYQGGAASSERFQILSRLSLGKDQMLLVVKAADHILLLGVTSQTICLLKELEEAEWPTSSGNSSRPVHSDFLTVFKGMLKRSDEKGSGEGWYH